MASFVRPLLESRKKKPKSIIKEAEGTLHPRNSKPKKFTKPSAGKNLAKEAGVKHKKRGPFGETYQPVQAGQNKGVRVAESNRFRESVSAEDLRGMVQRALRVKFPPPPPGSFSGYPQAEVSPSYSSPYVKDIFPDDKMAVFEMNSVPWGVDFTVNERAGTAKLSNIRRVKVEYADFDDDSKTKESKFGESVFGKKKMVGATEVGVKGMKWGQRKEKSEDKGSPQKARQSVGESASKLSDLAEKLHGAAEGGRSSVGTSVNNLAGQLENIYYRDSAADKEKVGNIAGKLSDLAEKLHGNSPTGRSSTGTSLNKIAGSLEESYYRWRGEK